MQLGFLAGVICLLVSSATCRSWPWHPFPPNTYVDAGGLGWIQGSAAQTAPEGTSSPKPYVQFRGIPYATIPKRFAPSVLNNGPLAQHGKIFNASSPGLACNQPFMAPNLVTENCLTINVYTKNAQLFPSPHHKLLPVIFFVHGGDYLIGYGDYFNGGRILNRDVVFVTFNYRLGIAGAFTLLNDDAPGNAAMYDVINALEWTSKYIRHFGGDPKNITIAGQSSGSVIVTQLMASPMAQGKFKGAIGLSGSALNIWGTGVQTSSALLTQNLAIASIAGCFNQDVTPVPNFVAIAACMRAIPAESLVAVYAAYQGLVAKAGGLPLNTLAPIVQNFPLASTTKFLSVSALTTFAAGAQANVPLMMGNTKNEGSYPLGVAYNSLLLPNGLQNNVPYLKTQLIPFVLGAFGVSPTPFGVYDSLAARYVGLARHTGIFSAIAPGLTDIIGFLMFKAGGYQTALYQSKLNSVYWYSFEFQGQFSLFSTLFFGQPVPPVAGGVAHGDDTIYLFPITPFPFTPAESAVSSRLIDYWVNFAATGNPTPSNAWPKLDSYFEFYMTIGASSTPSEYYTDEWKSSTACQ